MTASDDVRTSESAGGLPLAKGESTGIIVQGVTTESDGAGANDNPLHTLMVKLSDIFDDRGEPRLPQIPGRGVNEQR